MLDVNQILLSAVVVTLTTLMVFIGLQIYHILSEIRKMLIKFNTMADGAVNFTNNMGKSFQNLSGFTEGLKAILGLFHIFKKKKEEKNNE